MLSIMMEGEEGEKDNASFLKRMEMPVSIACYTTCSVSMILLNKLIIDSKGFHFPFVLVFFQNLSAVVVVISLKLLGVIDYPGLKEKLIKRWLPLVVLFVGMLMTSLMALKTMSVPVQTLIKSLAIFVTAAGDSFLFGRVFNKLMVFSFVLLIMGSLLGATTDRWVTMEGLVWSFSNVACTSGYQLYMKGVLNDLKDTMGKWGPVYYNNLLSLPPLLLPVMYDFNGWFAKLKTLDDSTSITYITLMILISAVMTMSSFWCMRVTNPTTYGVIGGMNKIPLTLLGIWIFEQYPTTTGAIGIVSAIAGGLVYTHAVQLNSEPANLHSISLSPPSVIRSSTSIRNTSKKLMMNFSLTDKDAPAKASV
eukprot:TRINITY_DN2194_c1_g1_i1.p1 TRINITY_DN2194_c1_g1~~TRINITY_DN2194_c1_g1_i1.p1  ORF type:complete len:364 (+),score=75.19 TRINITY_DN2194_c1_g1_i1:33-1124(+)